MVDYANALAAKGHRCTLVVPALGCAHGLGRVISFADLRPTLGRIVRGRAGIPWARLDDGTRVLRVVRARSTNLPDADVTVATAWQTAPVVAAAPDRCGRRLYFIQGYEVWSAGRNPAAVDTTWQLPMHKGVIANWLMAKAEALGEGARTTYLPNGLDLERLRVTVPVEQRDPLSVGMLVHNAPIKATNVGLRAIELARAEIGDLHVHLYGADPPTEKLPGWARFSEALSPLETPGYFNRLAIFVHPSLSEGFGLPPAEAMACGAALVAANNEGVMDYAVDGETAKLVERGSAEQMADAIVALVRDQSERIRMARAGHEAMRRFNFPDAADRFEQLLRTLTETTSGS